MRDENLRLVQNNDKLSRNMDKFRKNNLYYDLQCNPQDYFTCMIFMMKEVEKRGYTTTTNI